MLLSDWLADVSSTLNASQCIQFEQRRSFFFRLSGTHQQPRQPRRPGFGCSS